jgi:heterodisulfide reductase subunit D
MTMRAQILRYDPSTGESPSYNTYEVPYVEGMTLLDLLRSVCDDQDPTLCFRSSCGIGKCGSCAVSMNGRPVLSCRQELTKGEGELVIEPLPNFPVIKDLVVDRERFDRMLSSVLVSAIENAACARLVPPREERDPAQPDCIECLACDAACPVVTELPDQYLGPALTSGLAGMGLLGELPPSVSDSPVSDNTFCCLQCDACTMACPAHVPVGQCLLDVKRDLAEAATLPDALRSLSTTICRTGNISGDDNKRRLIWGVGHENRGVGHASEVAEIVYYVGCLSSFYPSSYRVPQSFTRILDTAGVRYQLMGPREWCCGYPLLLAGLPGEARRAAERNVEWLRGSGATRVVTTCPSCYYMWRQVYPRLLDCAAEFEVVHATEYLVELLAQNRLPLRERVKAVVTYHDPCDLGRKSGVYEAPRRLLTDLSSEITLVEMEDHHDSSLCCGGGGNVQGFKPELTESVSRRRVEQAAGTGAGILTSACPQCERVLRQAAKEGGFALRVLDVVQLVADSLAGSVDEQRAGEEHPDSQAPP